MTEPVRLSKCVIALTGCSRREAEFYIEGGSVLVDGQIIDEPQFKITTQKVELKPDAKPEPVEPVTLLLHKPAGIDCQAQGGNQGENQGGNPGEGQDQALALLVPGNRVEHDDPGIHVLRRHFLRQAIAAPLDRQASGLVVYTQDWQVARKLGEDAASIEQEYNVDVAGSIADGGMERLNRERRSGNWTLPAVKVSWQNEARLRFAGKALDPATIRELCASVGLQATLVKRLRIGSIAMSKLPPGQWRYLPRLKRF